MNDDLKIWLPPMLTLLGTLVVVVFTAWLNTRAVLAHVEKGIAELRLELNSKSNDCAWNYPSFEARCGLMRAKSNTESRLSRTGRA